MAKKTAKKAAAPKTAPAAKPKAAKKAPAPATPSIDSDAIGHAAGDVWGFLHGKDPQTLAAVKKAASSADLALMAVGWLAREGKLDFTASGRSVKVSLK